MVTAEALSELIGLIYRAGADVALWPDTLRRVARAVHGESALLQRIDLTTLLPESSLSIGRDPHLERSLATWAPRNCFIPRSRHLPSGSVSADFKLVPRREFLASDFYQGWFRPQEIAWTVACNIDVNVDSMTHVVFGRHGRGANRFGKEDLRLLALLSPHLRQAIHLHNRLVRHEVNLRQRADILDRCAAGVVVVDAESQLVLLNAAAEVILLACDGLHARGRRLGATDIRADRLLRSVIVGATSRRTVPVGASVTIEREKTARPLAVSVVPFLADDERLETRKGHALLILTEPDAPLAASPKQLDQLYGLTPAEARVALSLAATGHDPSEIANELNLSAATVRTHLQRIFEKTHTHRQAELIALLYRVLGPFRLQ
jgi:DNA-binding CsgD family transcriptional regulator